MICNQVSTFMQPGVVQTRQAASIQTFLLQAWQQFRFGPLLHMCTQTEPPSGITNHSNSISNHGMGPGRAGGPPLEGYELLNFQKG